MDILNTVYDNPECSYSIGTSQTLIFLAAEDV